MGGAFGVWFSFSSMSWQALTSVAVSQGECSGAARREGTRGGRSREERCSTPRPSTHSVSRQEELLRPGSASRLVCRGLAQCHHQPPAACTGPVATGAASPCWLPSRYPSQALASHTVRAWGREAPLLQSGHSGPCLRSPTWTLRHVLASPVSMILSVRLSICVFPALCRWIYSSGIMHTSLWQPQSNPLHVGLNSQSSNIK